MKQIRRHYVPVRGVVFLLSRGRRHTDEQEIHGLPGCRITWADPQHGRGTALMEEWSIFKQRNPKARMVCIDIQPYATTQAPSRDDVLNVGGFSDAVFDLVAQFAGGTLDADLFVNEIEKEPNAVGTTSSFHDA